MIVIKNNKEYPYDEKKIRNAIIQAYIQVRYPDYKFIDILVDEITDWAQTTAKEDKILVDNLENYVISVLYREVPEVGRVYSQYKIHKEEAYKNPSEIEKVLFVSPEIEHENGNKDPHLTHITNAYLAEIPGREFMREQLPKECLSAHDRGVVYFHDMAYSGRPMHNCLARETSFITDKGIKSFYDFNDGDITYVLSADGNYHKATVHCYGEQKLYRNTFYRGKKTNTQDVLATKNHRWYLKDDKVTTDLKIGDRLKSAPYLFNFELSDEEYNKLPQTLQLMWCKGFALGDGTKEYGSMNKLTGHTRIRLCGNKNTFLSRFNIKGCHIRTQIEKNGDHFVIVENYQKEIPNFNTIEEIKYFFLGLYEADGRHNSSSKRIQSSNKDIVNFIRTFAPTVGAYITGENELTGEKTNLGERGYTVCFNMINCHPSHFSYTLLKQEFERIDTVWCLEVEDTHNFVLSNGILTGNCDLLDLDTLFQGCEINGIWIETPKSFKTACTVATQILTHATSQQYGGITVNLLHLAKFVRVSREKIQKKYENFDVPNDIKQELIDLELNSEIKDGMQTFLYQNNTLCAGTGQAVFLSVSTWLNEDPEYTDDLILVFTEFIKQRIKGIKQKDGTYINPNFPKILYFLDEDTMRGGKYYDVTKLCAECSAKRLVPDYLSVKVHKELKGVPTPPMGCRSLLHEYINPETGKHELWGRWNMGVQSLNLPYIAMENNPDRKEEILFSNLDYYLDIAHRDMLWRANHIAKIKAGQAPLLWVYGGLTKLNPEETLEKEVYSGRPSISLGYAGLYECVYYITGENQFSEKGNKLAHKILDYLNDSNAQFKKDTGLAAGLYGTPKNMGH